MAKKSAEHQAVIKALQEAINAAELAAGSLVAAYSVAEEKFGIGHEIPMQIGGLGNDAHDAVRNLQAQLDEVEREAYRPSVDHWSAWLVANNMD